MPARTARRSAVACLLVAGSAGLLATGEASAASLVYLAPNAAGKSEIAAARPDGSAARVLVASSGLATSFAALSTDDAGRIYAFSPKDGALIPALWRFDQTGKQLDYEVFDTGGSCGYISPFRSAARPDGTFVLATYYKGTGCGGTFSTTPRTDYIASNTPTANGTYPGFSNAIEPRFLRNGYPLAISDLTSIAIGTGASQDAVGTLQTWQTAQAGIRFESTDVDPTGGRGILELTPDVDGAKIHTIQLYTFSGAVPTPTSAVTYGCAVDLPGGATDVRARPRWSPDGTTIAWTGPAGIYTAPAPTPGGPGGDCNLSPKLTIPGGKEPEWARFDLADLPASGGSGGGTGTGTGTGSGTGSGSGNGTGGGTGGSAAPTLTVTKAPATAKTKDFAKSLKVTVNAPAAGAVKAQCTITGAQAKKARITTAKKPPKTVTVCTGSARATAAGALTITLKPTKQAKLRASKLAGLSITVRLTFGTTVVVQKVKLKQ